VKNQEMIKGKSSYQSHYRNRYSNPDLMKLLNSQSNQKVIDSFLRYSKVAGKTPITLDTTPRTRLYRWK